MNVFDQAAAWDAVRNGEPVPVIEAKGRRTHPKKTWQPKRPPKPGKGKGRPKEGDEGK